MNKVGLVSIMAAAILAGCSDPSFMAETGTSPKMAADLCHGAKDVVSGQSQEQKKIIDAYRADEITFEECMRRLRG